MTKDSINEASSHYQLSTLDAQLNEVPVGYKQTEVGVIPEDWEVTSVGQVTSWLSGGTPNRKRDDYWQGDIPWISGFTLKTLELKTSDQFLTSDGVDAGSKMAPLDSTLLLVRGSALHSEIRAGLVVAPLCFNQDVKALIPNKNIVPRYLTIYLLAMESELLKLVSSAGNSAGVLDTELVKNFKFLQPPKQEQTAIANALSDVDALISELEKLIAKNQAIKTATMQQLLTGRTRLPPFALREDGTKKGTKQSELGEIPEDWVIKILSEISTMHGRIGWQGLKQEEFTFNDRQPFLITGMNFKDGSIRWDEVYHIAEDRYEMDKNIQLQVGDILMTKDGTIGKLLYVNHIPSPGKATLNSHLLVFRPKQNTYKPAFLYYLMKTEVLDKHIEINKSGSTFFGITQAAMSKLRVYMPSIEEQTAIATILSDMDEELQALEQRLSKTRQIKQGMMQELLTGKTRLIQRSEAV